MVTKKEARAPAGDDRGGFTLVEVIIAVVILAVGLLGLAGTTGWVVRQTAFADATTERSAARQSVVESIRATPLDQVADGSRTVDQFTITWTVTASTADSKTIEVVTVGPGLGSGGGALPSMQDNISDTFTFQMIDLRP